MSYAIISVGGKQYRVSAGERLLVDRLALDDGATFNPTVLLVGGDGDTQIAPAGAVVTAKVVTQAKGPKIRIGKYKQRTGYKRHTGFRASLTQIEIESIGGAGKSTAKQAAKPKAAAPAKDETPAETTAGPGSRRAPRGLRRPHRRAGQGGGSRLGRRGASCSARLRAGARQAQGRDRRARGRDLGGRFLMAHKKGLGSSKNGRDSQSQAARREDLRRPGGQGRDDHRAAARNALPSRPRRRDRPRRHALRAPRGHRRVPPKRRAPFGGGQRSRRDRVANAAPRGRRGRVPRSGIHRRPLGPRRRRRARLPAREVRPEGRAGRR